jgi:hypothetical protein
MPFKKPTVAELVELVHSAAAAAANFQERFAATDTEARKIVDIMERFLRLKGRVVYGGAAINAHMSPANRFYDPALYLPDYDFMTPDPLQDCADLIVAFQDEGFKEVEAKFGIHEGTYKIFVNYRSAADITFMPEDIYNRVVADSDTIDGIRYASVNFLRMNIYLELSRPSGDVSRWEKIYKRLLLLNEEHPIKAGRCVDSPLVSMSKEEGVEPKKTDVIRHTRLVNAGINAAAVFLSGASYLIDKEPRPDEVVMIMTPKRTDIVATLKSTSMKPTDYPANGELLPARTELRVGTKLVAVIFETVACHNYTTLKEPAGYRLGSIDLLIQMYYAMYFTDLHGYLPTRLLCVIQQLIEMEASRREAAVIQHVPAHDVFPLECIGHQPSLPELKKAHRERVKEKRKDLIGALKQQRSNFRITRRRGRGSKN